MSERRLQALLASPGLRDADAALVAALLDAGEVRPVHGGQILFRPGEPFCGCLQLPIDTAIELRWPGGQTAQLEAGELCGLANLLDHADYVTTAVVQADGELLWIGEARWRALLAERPALQALVDRQIARRLRQLQRGERVTGRLATPLYRLMKSPVAHCGPDTTIREAFDTMQGRKIGSLLVRDGDTVYGMLTFAGLAEALIHRGAGPDQPVREAACERPVWLRSGDPAWRAQEALERHAVKYLLVMEDERPVGIVSQSDLVRLLHAEEGSFVALAVAARDLEELRGLVERLPALAREAHASHHRASDALRWLSEVQLALQRRALALCAEDMRREGLGGAPGPYAVIVMGSAGRREMLFGADQDNGLIYADGIDEAEAVWFAELAGRFNRALDMLGWPLCPGEVMARNPEYRRPLAGWCERVDHITSHPGEASAMWSNIVFDFDGLYGDQALVERLRRHVLARVARRRLLLRRMAEQDAEGRPAIGLFDRLLTHKGARGEYVDIKRNGLRLIADAVRIFALSRGVAATHTIDRLRALVRAGALPHGLMQVVADAYDELLDIALTHQLRQLAAGELPDKQVPLDELTPLSRERLRMAMRAVKQFQEEMHGSFDVDIF